MATSTKGNNTMKRQYKASQQAIALNNKLMDLAIDTAKRKLVDMLVTLYVRQEEIERECGTALFQNQKGFNKADSKVGVQHVEQIMETGKVTQDMLVHWFSPERGSSKIAKYWRQFQN